MCALPGTTKRWVNPSPAHPGATLVVHSGFVVDHGRTRDLERRARALGFADLRGYLQARSDAGLSVPRLGEELGGSDWTIKRGLTQVGVQLPPRPQRLARQRRHATEERVAARVAELGFTGIKAYLADRLIEQAWLLADVTTELGAHRVAVRRLMDQHGIRRIRRTARAGSWPPGSGAGGVRSVSWQARRPAGRAGLCGSDRLPCPPASGAGLVGAADAGGASGGPPLDGRRAGTARHPTMTRGTAGARQGQ
jgi:hypothetical protein